VVDPGVERRRRVGDRAGVELAGGGVAAEEHHEGADPAADVEHGAALAGEVAPVLAVPVGVGVPVPVGVGVGVPVGVGGGGHDDAAAAGTS
jgi:hypothetical protein